MCDGFVIIFIFKYIHIFILAELSSACKEQKHRKRMKQAKTQDMQALWKCTKTGSRKLVKFNSHGLFEYKK